MLDRHDFAYLIDFGIALVADETRITKTGNTIGSFSYIAPERLNGRAEDARADIYSLACVLCQALTGHPPFAGDNMGRLVAAHLNDRPPRPSATHRARSHSPDPATHRAGTQSCHRPAEHREGRIGASRQPLQQHSVQTDGGLSAPEPPGQSEVMRPSTSNADCMSPGEDDSQKSPTW
ncbi:protein kinase domain-containing protein [Mycobacterium sp.]|uniref:protein kinase domain-containing protein n=1 Tax=Mycobacterium sp. TaxID=1785 RepID=UPI0039C9E4AB